MLELVHSLAIGLVMLTPSAEAESPVSQQPSPAPTLKDPGPPKWGGFGGVHLQPSALGEHFAMLVGGAGGVIFRGRLALGAAGYGLTHFAGDLRDQNDRQVAVTMGYGGVLVGAMFGRIKFVDFGADLLLGGGTACLLDNDARNTGCLSETTLFVAQPEASVRFRLARFFRLSVGVGYRIAVSEPWALKSEPENMGLSGFTGNLGVEWGWF